MPFLDRDRQMTLRSFSRAVSLGQWCQTASQLRRQFGLPYCSSGVFDYQITPPEAVIEKRDFRGMFNREDLIFDGTFVCNARYKTRHDHEFKNGLDADYEQARKRHDYLCDKLRRVVLGTTATLLVLQTENSEDVAREVSNVISKINRDLPFRVVAVARPDIPPSRPEAAWEGNDDYWRDVLRQTPINLTLDGRPRTLVSDAMVRIKHNYSRLLKNIKRGF
jgi:hypothetical protein